MEVLSIVVAAATALQIAVLVALHVLPTGYNPVRDALSDYGVGRYRAVFWAQVWLGGLARVGLAFALLRSHPSKPGLVVALLLVSAAALVLMPAFPTDQGGSRFRTPTGTVHMVLAVTAFAAVTVAASNLAGTLRHDPAWHGVKSLVVILPWVMTGTVIATAVATIGPRLKRVFGLIERLFTASSIAWFLVVTIELARIAC